MNKNKFEKQNSGMISLNFENTPVGRPFELPMKDAIDNVSFTLKSRDDPFANNHGFEDYEFSNFSFKGDKTKRNNNASPMTRRQKDREINKLKEQIKVSPDRFTIDWDKMSHCPCCKQKLPKSPKEKGNGSPIKSPRNRPRQSPRVARMNGGNTRRARDDNFSEGSDFRIDKHLKKAEIDPNLNKRRKSKNQVKQLEAELEANPHWTNEDMVKIAKRTGLSKSQVYKWNWDQKKKLNILPSKVYVVQLPSDLIDTKTGQLLIKSADGLKRLQTLNLETVVQKPNKK